MPTLTFGPLHLARRLEPGPALRHGPLDVVLVARTSEVRWQGAGLTLGWRLAEPDHVRLATLAGQRQIDIRPPREAILALLAGGALLGALGLGRALAAGLAARRRRHGR